MPDVFILRLEKVADVSEETALELVEKLAESDKIYPYVLDNNIELSEKARKELEGLISRAKEEPLEIVIL
ncbi:hypothetical protein HRbin02_01742 [Candidatus Calditenuaceae archaeon HR02]|nr:hypothetical protein HRbin02_01742 [Candidatus Calditenuaceae archaeon HR02]